MSEETLRRRKKRLEGGWWLKSPVKYPSSSLFPALPGSFISMCAGDVTGGQKRGHPVTFPQPHPCVPSALFERGALFPAVMELFKHNQTLPPNLFSTYQTGSIRKQRQTDLCTVQAKPRHASSVSSMLFYLAKFSSLICLLLFLLTAGSDSATQNVRYPGQTALLPQHLEWIIHNGDLFMLGLCFLFLHQVVDNLTQSKNGQEKPIECKTVTCAKQKKPYFNVHQMPNRIGKSATLR